MAESFTPNLNVVLTHYPVRNKAGETIASAVTNLDLHDIARAARTFGARSFYVVTPLADQHRLVERIVAHWTQGYGGEHNPDRRSALEMVRVRDSLAQVAEEIQERDRSAPRVIATCATPHPRNIGCDDLRLKLMDGRPHILLFGTAWGLAEEVIRSADYVLDPVCGPGRYNHLSVRSAAAVILDRLFGRTGDACPTAGDDALNR